MSKAGRTSSTLTVERLRELLDYDPATGVFRWRVSRGRVRAGTIAGTVNLRGYRLIKIDRCNSALAHRLAWLHVYGRWPDGDLDHKDNVPGHDWIDNLRPATKSENLGNMRRHRDNRSGFKGVSFQANGWVATIMVDRKYIFIGRFRAPEEAHAAYVAKAKELFGEFANGGEVTPPRVVRARGRAKSD